MSIHVDTLAAKKKLVQGGFDDAQAEIIVQVFADVEQQVATKQYIDLLRRDLTLKIIVASIGAVAATVIILQHLLVASG